MTLARIDFDTDTLSWVGVGNVTADLVAKAPSGVEARSSARLGGGIVGYRIPESPVTQVIPIRPGHLLVIASDGIARNHLEGLDFAAAAVIAGRRVSARQANRRRAGARRASPRLLAMTEAAGFRSEYAAALYSYLEEGGEASLGSAKSSDGGP